MKANYEINYLPIHWASFVDVNSSIGNVRCNQSMWNIASLVSMWTKTRNYHLRNTRNMVLITFIDSSIAFHQIDFLSVKHTSEFRAERPWTRSETPEYVAIGVFDDNDIRTLVHNPSQ